MVAVQDLFTAGSDTSSNATGDSRRKYSIAFNGLIYSSHSGFALLYLIRYPDVQKRMQTELDEVCGDSLPSLAHRSRYLFSLSTKQLFLDGDTQLTISIPDCLTQRQS